MTTQCFLFIHLLKTIISVHINLFSSLNSSEQPEPQCVTHLNNPDVTLVGALGDLNGLSDELPVAAHVGTAAAAPPATAAAESTA
jgi:hypothetical protein